MCGYYDDDDFDSSVMCCACGGGRMAEVPKPLNTCIDTNGQALDEGSDSCSWYETHSSRCGDYDDEDFSASEMCCACNGGRTVTYEPIVDEEV